ncbi:MAG: hypothetical protein J0H68_02575 [Sphingobacteriia bacterium]|nr:hypothetical protein [Sphingobacteriia bacterium]
METLKDLLSDMKEDTKVKVNLNYFNIWLKNQLPECILSMNNSSNIEKADFDESFLTFWEEFNFIAPLEVNYGEPYNFPQENIESYFLHN